MIFGNYSLTSIVASILAVLVAITFHEVAHGYVAYLLGDNTAKDQGRLTLNPVAHLDPVGALLMLVVGFGWAKPVPVNAFYFKGDRTKGMMLVSVAGPATNLILAFIFTIVNRYAQWQPLAYFSYLCVFLNLYLAIFNLIPIPPLDGSKILAGFLPRQIAYQYLNAMERYGFLILFVLIVFGVTGMIIQPIATFILSAFLQIISFLP